MRDDRFIHRARAGSYRAATVRRRGGALALALIVAVTVAAAASAILLFTMHFTRKQAHAVHDQRAFYLAEAGLSEAYQALTSGKTGQIGSFESPATSGGGFLWVDATEGGDGTVRLESTAVSGLGRSTLALVVERVEQPLGIFADEDLVIDAPLMVDGYDSETAPYVEQVGLIKIPLSDVLKQGVDADGRTIIATLTGEYLVVDSDSSYCYCEPLDTTSIATTDPIQVDSDPVLGTGWGGTGGTTPTDGTTSTSDPADTGDPATSDPVTSDPATGDPVTSDPVMSDPVTSDPATEAALAGVHTSGGGKLASNGSIIFTGTPAVIYGDAVPGPNGQVVLADGVTVTGHTESRSEVVELPAVTLPVVDLLPFLEHGGAVPLVIPPTTIGYQGLRVLPNAELVLRGPSTVVIGTFELLDGADLTVENLDGPVDLFVTQTADFALGSTLQVLSQDPSQLTLRILGPADPIVLASTGQFHGMVYGPEAAIEVESPFELYGVLVGRTLDLGANVRLHFDSGIAGSAGRLALPKLISWDVAEVPPEVRARVSPVELFGRDEGAATAPVDAGVTNSWTFSIRFHSVDSAGKWVDYDGPLQDFDWSQVLDYNNSSLDPPQVEFTLPWTITSRYLDFSGNEHEYAGPVANFPIYSLERELERTLVPPPELGALGVQPYFDTFIDPNQLPGPY